MCTAFVLIDCTLLYDIFGVTLMLEIKSINPEHKKAFKALYRSSFPDSERKPYYLMKYWQMCGKMELYELSDGDKFCGLFITVICGELVLVDYLAVCPEMRGRGVGSKALELAREKYRGKRLFLEIETTEKACEDLELRLKRKNFYLKNGLSPCGFSVNLFGVEMEILAFDKKITYDEYMKLYRYMAGRLLKLKIELIN